MTFADIRVDTPYLVTKESDDGSFQVGDQITLLEDGSLINPQAEGWLEAEDLVDATAGMECEVDRARLQRRKESLLRRLAALEALDDGHQQL